MFGIFFVVLVMEAMMNVETNGEGKNIKMLLSLMSSAPRCLYYCVHLRKLSCFLHIRICVTSFFPEINQKKTFLETKS